MKKLFELTILIVAILTIGAIVHAEPEPFLLRAIPSTKVSQGDSVVIIVKTIPSMNSYELSLTAFDKAYPLFTTPKPGVYRLPLGISTSQKPGTYNITLRYWGLAKSSFTLIVEKKLFPSETIVLVPKKASLTTSQTLVNETNMIGTLLRATRTHTLLGSGKFVYPIKNKITSAFGYQRIYKSTSGQVVNSWAHRGVDFGGKPGEPVVAVNSGKIIMVKEMPAHGGTIMIDHGQSVISLYTHVGGFKVKVGDMVQKGQVIAGIGSTGIATGPHVHLGLSVNNVRVNPIQWITHNMMGQ